MLSADSLMLALVLPVLPLDIGHKCLQHRLATGDPAGPDTLYTCTAWTEVLCDPCQVTPHRGPYHSLHNSVSKSLQELQAGHALTHTFCQCCPAKPP